MSERMPLYNKYRRHRDGALCVFPVTNTPDPDQYSPWQEQQDNCHTSEPTDNPFDEDRRRDGFYDGEQAKCSHCGGSGVVNTAGGAEWANEPCPICQTSKALGPHERLMFYDSKKQAIVSEPPQPERVSGIDPASGSDKSVVTELQPQWPWSDEVDYELRSWANRQGVPALSVRTLVERVIKQLTADAAALRVERDELKEKVNDAGIRAIGAGHGVGSILQQVKQAEAERDEAKRLVDEWCTSFEKLDAEREKQGQRTEQAEADAAKLRKMTEKACEAIDSLTAERDAALADKEKLWNEIHATTADKAKWREAAMSFVTIAPTALNLFGSYGMVTACKEVEQAVAAVESLIASEGGKP